MAARPLVIVHGWSDVSRSFEPLARLLRERLDTEVSIIKLADYLSMEDEIRFDDLCAAMDAAWNRHRLPRGAGRVDAIVHSTGGLVIRDWLNREFAPSRAPVKHLVMLAPANFGSPLAHKGRSFIGRVFKGFIAKKPEGERFQTGTHILKGLELASPYSWELAERDRFGPGAAMYGRGNVLCTVLVGNTGYDGISSIANEDGSDGTVRLSTANLECVKIDAAFPANPDDPKVGHDVDWGAEPSGGETAFGVVDGFNHGTITLGQCEDRTPTKDERGLLDEIVAALRVTDSGFGAWCRRLADRTDALLPARPGDADSSKHGFQNTVVRVVDQFGAGVPDFLLEFYEKDDDMGRIARLFHETAIKGVHPYSDDNSYRSVYVNCTELTRTIDKVGEYLSVSLTAHPEIGDDCPVGFTTLGDDGIGGIRIRKKDIDEFFVARRTALVTLQLTRQQLEKTFDFRDAPPS